MYTVTCTGPGGTATDSVTVTTNPNPNFIEPIVASRVLSLGFSSTTGTYDSIEFPIQITNQTGSPTTNAASYRFEFDRNQDGTYDENTTEDMGLFAMPESKPFRPVLTNVAYGPTRIRITADSGNAVAETNESDNILTLDWIVPPPGPGLTLTATPAQVRNGQSATVSWTRTATYPMNCRVFGPGINLTAPLAFPGTQSTGPLTAKSEYTLECTEPVTGTVFREVRTVEVAGAIEEI
jgi:hypothetical protein